MLKYLKKSSWHYWYTGKKQIALAGMGLGLTINTILFMASAGVKGGFSLIIAIIFDQLLLPLLGLYLWKFREWNIPYISEKLDNYFFYSVLLLSIGVLINRFSVNWVAEKFFHDNLN